MNVLDTKNLKITHLFAKENYNEPKFHDFVFKMLIPRVYLSWRSFFFWERWSWFCDLDTKLRHGRKNIKKVPVFQLPPFTSLF